MSDFPVEITDASARLELDEAVYPLEALYGAAYIFIDRCYVLIDKPAPGKFRVTLAAKKDVRRAERSEASSSREPVASGMPAVEELQAMAGEFANELLSCAWRHQITQQNRAVIEAVTTQAIAGAMGPPSLDDLEKFDFSAETFEDPLGIAKSWEEKYKKK